MIWLDVVVMIAGFEATFELKEELHKRVFEKYCEMNSSKLNKVNLLFTLVNNGGEIIVEAMKGLSKKMAFHYEMAATKATKGRYLVNVLGFDKKFLWNDERRQYLAGCNANDILFNKIANKSEDCTYRGETTKYKPIRKAERDSIMSHLETLLYNT